MVEAMRSPHHQSGFTLIELMLTLAVLGILTTLAVPSFSSYIANQRVKAAAYDLLATLNYARSEAIKRNDTVTVTSNASGWSEGWAISAGGVDIQTYDPESTVAITEGNTLTAITYGGNGRITTAGSNPPVFHICDPDGRATVTRRIIRIDLTGRPNLTLGGPCNA